MGERRRPGIAFIRSVALAVVPMVVVAGACGGSSDGDVVRVALTDAFAGGRRSLSPSGTPESGDPVVTTEEAACIADGLVDSLGADRIRELGLGQTPWSLLGYGLRFPIERADAKLMVTVFAECTPRWKLLMVTSVTSGAEFISEPSANCVADALDDSVATDIFIKELARDDLKAGASTGALDYLTNLVDAMKTCLSAREMNALDFN